MFMKTGVWYLAVTFLLLFFGFTILRYMDKGSVMVMVRFRVRVRVRIRVAPLPERSARNAEGGSPHHWILAV